MNLKTRRRILGLARFLERRAKGLRAYVKRKTPRRKIINASLYTDAELRHELAARRAEDHRDEQAELRKARGEDE